jgi:hypothetical protein
MAGCADLEFMWRERSLLCVLFLELKMPGRRQSQSQLDFMNRVKSLGPYCVARSINEALAALDTYGLLTETRIGTISPPPLPTNDPAPNPVASAPHAPQTARNDRTCENPPWPLADTGQPAKLTRSLPNG